MIKSKDRSGWFGASDTNFIIGNWNTKTFHNWWLEKLGIRSNNFTNEYLMAGTYYEHKILESLDFNIEKDKQIIIPELKLRVNLDGNTQDTIYEVKTHLKPFKVTRQYFNQVQVQMFATGLRKAYIIAYQLTDYDYKNFFNDIDKKRISEHRIEYDEDFINHYLKKLKILIDCLEKGVLPC